MIIQFTRIQESTFEYHANRNRGKQIRPQGVGIGVRRKEINSREKEQINVLLRNVRSDNKRLVVESVAPAVAITNVAIKPVEMALVERFACSSMAASVPQSVFKEQVSIS